MLLVSLQITLPLAPTHSRLSLGAWRSSFIMAVAGGEITVLFFAKSRELVESSSAQLTLQPQTTGAVLKQSILTAYPALNVIADSFVLAHNQEYVDDLEAQIVLSAGDEVAIIPPISGG